MGNEIFFLYTRTIFKLNDGLHCKILLKIENRKYINEFTVNDTHEYSQNDVYVNS